MNIYDKLIGARDDYRLARNSVMATAAATVIGEIQRVYPKGCEDPETIAILKKLLKSYRESGASKEELDFISGFIPTELTKEEIIKIIRANQFPTIKEFMAYMKSNYAGRFDGKLASKTWMDETIQ